MIDELPGTGLVAVMADPVPPQRLSDDLRGLLAYAAGGSLTLRQIEVALKSRGFAIFILILALPFVFPIGIPGLSMIFGLVIALLGIRLAVGRKPWLPRFILDREIRYAHLEKTIRLGLRLTGWAEHLIKPRMHFLQRWPGMVNLIGLGITTGGILLSLPLPPFVPVSNMLPGWAVICLTAGMIERDGLLVLCGHALNLLSVAYFVFLYLMGEQGVRWLWHFFV